MIHVVLGTKAQLIKMAPVLLGLRRRGIPYRFVHTGQHQETMDEMLAEFGLPGPDLVLHRGGDVVTLPQMARWATGILARCLLRRRQIFGSDRRGFVLVHGDTLSTLLGALMGRVAGLRVGHVESGLRSFRWLHPFPEEITRVLVFRLAQTLYCPGAWAAANVAGYRGREVVDTHENTLVDALALAPRARRRDHVPDGAYALVSLHRYENIFRRERFEELLEILSELAESKRLLFILHPPTESQLARFGLRERLASHPRIELRPRYTYFDFATLLRGADYVVTDGGSIQEESSYLGLPCLLLRRATERREGMGANVLLSDYDRSAIRDFAARFEDWRRPAVSPERSPSEIIVESARRHGAGARGGSA